MRRGRHQPTPASHHNAGYDDRNVRHGCGFAYNGYVWSSCPKCEADDRRQYAMRCVSCRHAFYATEREDRCPECDSGNTTVIATPDSPATR